MRTRVVSALLIFLCIAGCAATPQPRKAGFDPAEYEPYSRPGTGTITGQAFLVTNGGDVKYGAGRAVTLVPVTKYSTEFYERCVRGGELLEQPDSRAVQFSRQVTANAEGRFKFTDLPPGEYYLNCWIVWYVTQYQTAGGFAYATVKVADGQTSDVIVSRR